MTLFTEHHCIDAALRSLGLDYAARGETRAAPEQTVPVFLAWSGRGELARTPEFAMLSHESVAYARLPLSRDDLESYVGLASRPAALDTELRELLTPLGQWRHALRALRAAVGTADATELRARAEALRRFALRRWPGLYERALDGLSRNAGDAERASRLTERLLAAADEGALTEALRPLTRWAEEHQTYERLASLEDALAYAAQGLIDPGETAGALADELDLARMESQISEAEEGLRVLRGLGCEGAQAFDVDPSALRDWLGSVRLVGAREAAADLEEARAAVGSLIRTAHRLIESRRQAVSSLNAAI